MRRNLLVAILLLNGFAGWARAESFIDKLPEVGTCVDYKYTANVSERDTASKLTGSLKLRRLTDVRETGSSRLGLVFDISSASGPRHTEFVLKVGALEDKIDSLRGIAACLKGSSCQQAHNASGVTFIDNKPDIVWKYVPIHELGHYFGLCHVDVVDRIRYFSRQNCSIDWWTLPKLLYTKGGPSFPNQPRRMTKTSLPDSSIAYLKNVAR